MDSLANRCREALSQLTPEEIQHRRMRIRINMQRKSLRAMINSFSKQLEEADTIWRTTYQKCKSSQ